MAIKVNFYLRVSDKKSVKDTTIFCRLTNGRKTDLRIPTGFSIKPAYWDSKTDKPKNTALYTDEDKEKIDYINEYLNGIEKSLIIGLNGNPSYSKENAMADIEAYKESKRTKPNEKLQDTLPFLDTIISEMKSGDLLNKSKPYSPNTIKVWNSFKKVLANFFKLNQGITWDMIDKAIFDKYVKFLINFGYTTKTANKYIICFNALMEFAYKRKQHNNKNITDEFYKIPEVEGCKTANIYLTNEEIQALYEMPLERGSTEDKVRDIFLCGCYTAQRISDYGRFTEENFTTTAKGTKVVKLVQKKTDNSVIIPILNKNVLKIAKKYNYNIPDISDVTINREIKLICKELSKSVFSLLRQEKTILTMKERSKEEKGKVTYERDKNGNVIKYRYDLVCTHTARRSAITNLYLTRLFDTYQLMSISGHKTEKAFKGYICLSSEEIADEITRKLEEQEKLKELQEVF
ncbi:MAG: phage integrase SAM-like domain-containing protein [Dysgonomonas sp.]|nr:phage integrase SAM-like domain-containing protein [Dysgonomonas sp.]